MVNWGKLKRGLLRWLWIPPPRSAYYYKKGDTRHCHVTLSSPHHRLTLTVHPAIDSTQYPQDARGLVQFSEECGGCLSASLCIKIVIFALADVYRDKQEEAEIIFINRGEICY